MLTRRHFLYGVAGVAALAAVGGGAVWAAGRSGDDDALKTLKVPESAVTAQTDLEEMENYEDAVTLAGSAKLPFGTLVWCSDDAVAACLLLSARRAAPPTPGEQPEAQAGGTRGTRADGTAPRKARDACSAGPCRSSHGRGVWAQAVPYGRPS